MLNTLPAPVGNMRTFIHIRIRILHVQSADPHYTSSHVCHFWRISCSKCEGLVVASRGCSLERGFSRVQGGSALPENFWFFCRWNCIPVVHFRHCFLTLKYLIFTVYKPHTIRTVREDCGRHQCTNCSLTFTA